MSEGKMNRPIGRSIISFCKVCGVELIEEHEIDVGVCKGCLYENEELEEV